MNKLIIAIVIAIFPYITYAQTKSVNELTEEAASQGAGKLVNTEEIFQKLIDLSLIHI